MLYIGDVVRLLFPEKCCFFYLFTVPHCFLSHLREVMFKICSKCEWSLVVNQKKSKMNRAVIRDYRYNLSVISSYRPQTHI